MDQAAGGAEGRLAFSTGRADPAGHLSLPHALDKPPIAQGIYRLSDGGDCAPPGVCARRRRRHGAFHNLRGAYFGEEVWPMPRKVEGEAEKPHAPMSAQVFGNGLYQPVHEEEGRGVWAGWRYALGVQSVDAGLKLVLVYISNV